MKQLLAILSFMVVAAGLRVSDCAAATLYDAGDPTPAEQLVLEMINRARADPAAEGTRLNIDISEGIKAGLQVVVRPPLAMNKILLQVAREHSTDMYTRSYFDHPTPEGIDPFQRMTAAGYIGISEGENIATSTSPGAPALEDLLMKDPGYPERAHRANLLDIRSNNGVYREIGIGYYTNSISNQMGRTTYLTQDFGLAGTTSFLLGVVYDDKNGNNFYDIGEGISGVTVTASSGNFYAVTSTSGGYAFPVGNSGQITITASGGTLASNIVKTITLEGINAKVDFKASEAGGNTGGSGITAPMLTSSSNANGKVGVAFSYQITASGTAPFTFTATSLPPFLTLSGDTISGTPTSSGTFVVSIGATNGAGSDGQLLAITVAPADGGTGTIAPVIGNTTIDTDSDGFVDEIETALGTSSNNATSTPFGGSSAGTAQSLLVQKLGIKLNFAKTLSDSIKFGGTLPIPQSFIVTNQQVTVDTAGVIRTFVLDAKGSSPKSTTDQFKLKLKIKAGLAPAQDAKYALKLSKGDFAALLADENLINGNVTAGPVAVPIIILFNGKLFRSDEQRLWYAKAGKTGKTK